MDHANRLLNGSGIEALRGEGYHVDNYHHDLIATYVNFGDTYVTTLLYDTEAATFFLTSWGEWFEQWEQEHQPLAERSAWEPKRSDRPVVALRSVEGEVVAVHALTGDPERLAFSISEGSSFYGDSYGEPIRKNIAQLNVLFTRRGELTVLEGVTLDRAQYERLLVALDSFLEHDGKQVDEFLDPP